MGIQFNEDAGPKSLHESVARKMRGDAALRTLTGYTRQNINIRRGFQPDGTWEKLVIFYFQQELPVTDFSPNVRRVSMIVDIYVKENELEVYDISERIIQLLDQQRGSDLSIPGKVFVYSCIYAGDMIPLGFDDSVQAFSRSLKFEMTIRKEESNGL